MHRLWRDDPGNPGGVFAHDTAIYDSQGLLHADIDTVSGTFNGPHLDPVGFQGQSGNYTDLETLHVAHGLYTSLSGRGGALYYDPETGVGLARAQADALNTYDQLLHPFDGWTFGAYAHEVGQFGIGEAKGAVNFVAGTLVSSSPAVEFVDQQTGGHLSAPIATTGTQAAGSAFIQPVLVVATFFVDPEEVAALGGQGARILGRVVGRDKHCFVAGTPVQMADGTTEPIERVKVGDFVKSRNPQTGQVEAKRVDRVYVRVAPQVVTLTFTDSHTHQAQAFTCTPEHPFYVDGKGFVQAGDLGIGTSIVTRAGPVLTLSAASWGAASGLASGSGLVLDGPARPAGVTVYNLRVEDDHSYFVGTAGGGTCVHNADYPIDPIKVESGGAGDDLAQIVADHRTAKGLNPIGTRGNNNLALFEYEETVDGQTVTRLKGFRSDSLGHAENNGLKHFRDRGMLDKVNRVYSEYHPCMRRGHMCLRNLQREVPRAKVYYSLPLDGRG